MWKLSNRNKNFILITLNLTVASIISGMILALTYYITKPFAKEQQIKLRNEAMNELVISADNFIPVENKEGWFMAKKSNQILAYIIPSEARGYGGTIKILMAVDTNEKIINFKILAHNETPGLGDRATLTNFQYQFRGKKIENMEIVKNHDTNKIDAITGATITSTAVTKAINNGLVEFKKYLNKRGIL